MVGEVYGGYEHPTRSRRTWLSAVPRLMPELLWPEEHQHSVGRCTCLQAWLSGRYSSTNISRFCPSLPGSLPPIIVYDRNGFRILLHFSQTGVPGHPEVQVLLLTMMSTATQPVWDIMFQVAVPKVSHSLGRSFECNFWAPDPLSLS